MSDSGLAIHKTRLLETYFPSDDDDSDYNPEEDEFNEEADQRENEEWDLIHRFENLDVGPADHFGDQPSPTSTIVHTHSIRSSLPSNAYEVFILFFTMFLIFCLILYVKSFSFRETVVFCDTGWTKAFEKNCKECPFRATCENGVAKCKRGFFLTEGGECLEDTELERIIQQLKIDVQENLAWKKGLHSCGMRKSHRIEELKLKESLRKKYIENQIFDEAYGNWKIRVLLKVYEGIIFKRPFFELGEGAHVLKPATCAVREFFWRNLNNVVAGLCTAIIILLSAYKYFEHSKLTRESEDLHYRVYSLLVDNAEKRQNVPVPLECIQTQFSPSTQVWKKVTGLRKFQLEKSFF